MADDEEHPKLSSQPRAMTMQFDAMQDAAEFLEGLADGEQDSGYQGLDDSGAGGSSKPPPLPPRGSLPSVPPSSLPPASLPPRASQAPPSRKLSPVIWVGLAVVAIAMAGLGVWVGNILTEEPPPPPEPTMDIQLGEIEVTPH